MDKQTMTQIIGFVKETDLVEFSLSRNDAKVYFRRNADEVPVNATPVDPVVAVAEPPAAESSVLPIRSLMVGTFYHSVAPDRPPFVVEGSHVSSGKKVGIIETMKVTKDVLSTVDGKIIKILVENAQHVEYGQELFVVDTSVPEENA